MMAPPCNHRETALVRARISSESRLEVERARRLEQRAENGCPLAQRPRRRFRYVHPPSYFPLTRAAWELVVNRPAAENLLDWAFLYLIALPGVLLFCLPVAIMLSLPAVPFVCLAGVKLGR
jgi:hypothetical protein